MSGVQKIGRGALLLTLDGARYVICHGRRDELDDVWNVWRCDGRAMTDEDAARIEALGVVTRI